MFNRELWKRREASPEEKEFMSCEPEMLAAVCDKLGLTFKIRLKENGFTVTTYPKHASIADPTVKGIAYTRRFSPSAFPTWTKKLGIVGTISGKYEPFFINVAAKALEKIVSQSEKAKTEKVGWQKEIQELQETYQLSLGKLNNLQKLASKLRSRDYRIEDIDKSPLNSSETEFQLIRVSLILDHLPVFETSPLVRDDSATISVIRCEEGSSRDWGIKMLREELANLYFHLSELPTDSSQHGKQKWYEHSGINNPNLPGEMLETLQRRVQQRLNNLKDEIVRSLKAIREKLNVPPSTNQPPASQGTYR